MKQQMELLAQNQQNLQASLDNSGPRNTRRTENNGNHNPSSGTTTSQEDGEASDSEVPNRISRNTEMAIDDLRGILQQTKQQPIITNRKGKAVTTLNSESIGFYFDSSIAQVILLNAMFLGLSLEYSDDSTAWVTVEVLFTVIFWFELLLKLKIHGCKEWFGGEPGHRGKAVLNIFDTCVVFADTLQCMFLLGPAKWESKAFEDIPISIFRLIKLMRLGRILRILRSSVFGDLFAMLQGLRCGLSTLVWALLVFLLFIYLVALMCKELLSQQNPGEEQLNAPSDNPETTLLFQTLPRAMLTVFRCSFGDCSTSDGDPLIDLLVMENSLWWGALYSLFTFMVVIGLFNVISAIFVQSTLAYAAEKSEEQLQERIDNQEIWAFNVTRVLKGPLMEQCPDMEELGGGELSDVMVSTSIQSEFSCPFIEMVVRGNGEVRAALSALDISVYEIAHLADTLDTDNTGSVSTIELVNGLRKLRGNPRRGDIIAVDLMIRSLQEKVDYIWRSTMDSTELKQQSEQPQTMIVGV